MNKERYMTEITAIVELEFGESEKEELRNWLETPIGRKAMASILVEGMQFDSLRGLSFTSPEEINSAIKKQGLAIGIYTSIDKLLTIAGAE